MASQVFISHSRKDEEHLLQLDRVFGKAEIGQYRANFEDQSPPVSEDLKQEINRSRAMFVVLGPNAEAATHTMIWIGWEAGIATQQGIPVWILEDVHSKVEMPIPSLTHYVFWNSKEESQQKLLRDLIESRLGRVKVAKVSPRKYRETELPEDFERNKDITGELALTSDPNLIRCPEEGCGEEYYLFFDEPKEFNCPSCRYSIRLGQSEFYEEV